VVTVGVVSLCAVAMYTILFMPTYAMRQLGLPASGSFLAVLLTGAIQLILIPVIGSLSDRYGRLPIAFAAAIAFLLAAYPMFAWLAAAPSLATLLVVQAMMGVLASGYMGGLAALMSEIFPVHMRTTGLSIGYAFGVAIFGGFAPIDTWLIEATGSKVAPSFYLILAAAISLVALGGARRLGMR
jgi:MHS family proline/betaine transporter-like MFS transporter